MGNLNTNGGWSILIQMVGGQPLHKQWMVNLVVIFTRNGEYKVRCKVTNSVLFASVDMGNISIKIHRCIISIIPYQYN